ncbi:hypothetical protein KC357_g301 [Hortaea werneckii]|nr:hypothetical protein KC357_g301 [Hortaea werneckii]
MQFTLANSVHSTAIHFARCTTAALDAAETEAVKIIDPAPGPCCLKIFPAAWAVHMAPSRLTFIISCQSSSAYSKLS